VRLLDPIAIGSRTAPNRVLFGPHVTNLGDDERRLTDRHVAYYERRARGGCGVIVTEGASVHPSDWPFERAPLAARCADGWAAIAGACRPHGTLVLASLDHAGGQGSSAYSQLPLWAPSRVPEVNTREVPKWMEAADVEAVIDGFADATRVAVSAGCDGVEVNAGQHSLVRQFLSGLTNHRDDEWGQDRTSFARRVLRAVREAAGDAVVALRLSCDELAPWAGITPEQAPELASQLTAEGVDLLVVTRGSIFSVEQTRPDFHEPPGFNVELCRAVRARVEVPVVLQGSVVDVPMAEWALGGGDDATVRCDLVEMTRAQIAEPRLVTHVRAGDLGRIRPCTRCNQACQVRDARNPLVTCIGEPTSGHETEDPDWYATDPVPAEVHVLGAGAAGLEAARVAAIRGHRVVVHERDERLGGLAAVAGPNAAIVQWLARECERLGVELHTGCGTGTTSCGGVPGPGGTSRTVVVQATGSVPGHPTYEVDDDATVLDVADVRRGVVAVPDEGDVVVLDPIGGPIGVAMAEELGARAVIVTQDHIAGNELARTGDLAPANVRLARAGVRIERRAIVRSVGRDRVVVEDRFTGVRRTIPCIAAVDCGFRLPDPALEGTHAQVGDCVAPRTVLEAILDARRAARSI
jgi:2,4-dienoyl-CoA reductase (NADPH2)